MSDFSVQLVSAPATAFLGEQFSLLLAFTARTEGEFAVDPTSLSFAVGPVGRPDRATRYDALDPLQHAIRRIEAGGYSLSVPCDVAGQFAWSFRAQLMFLEGDNGGDGTVLYREGRYSVVARVFG